MKVKSGLQTRLISDKNALWLVPGWRNLFNQQDLKKGDVVKGLIGKADLVHKVISDGRKPDCLWLIDFETREKIRLYQVKGKPISFTTEYQKVDIIETKKLGLVLMLDEVIQVAEMDEFIYHELLVHPACAKNKNKFNALVLGGGDGCAARELLRYPNLDKAVIVDIDKKLVEALKIHFKNINGGALENPKIKLETVDALNFLNKTNDKFDLIFSDLTDPSESEGPAAKLYSHDTFELVKSRLAPGGLFIIQSYFLDTTSVGVHAEKIGDLLKKVFESCRLYGDFVPSFDGLWCFWIAGDKKSMKDIGKPPEKFVEGLKFYDREAHIRAFSIPKGYGRPSGRLT